MKSRKKQIKFLAIGLFLAIILFPFILFLLVRFELICSLPTNEELRKIENPQASELYSDDGTLFAKFYTENRKDISLQQISPHFLKALVSTEDKRFYAHNGIDYKSLMRVAIKTLLLQRRSSGGGSTITQQLAKNVYDRQRFPIFSTFINKFREHIIAKKLEQIYSKEEILTLYANTVSFGEQAFGIATASHRFFNKQAADLTLNEAATLVGILKAPSYYSPRSHPERAKSRRNLVLRTLVENELLNDSIAQLAIRDTFLLNYQDASQAREVGRYFKDQIRKAFIIWSKANPKEDGTTYKLYTDGLKVHTTVDLEMQITAEKLMQDHMTRLQAQFLHDWKSGQLFGSGTKLLDEYILKDPLYKALSKKGKSNKEILTKFTTPEDRKYWSWEGTVTKKGTKIDSIKHYLSLLHTGILAADPQTGNIKVWLGGNDYNKFQLDNIIGPRQVGSTFKPFVYLTALEQGVKPCEYFKNELRTYKNYKDWTPKNADEKYEGYLPLFHALSNSVNTVSVQVIFRAGINKVIDTARELGIQSKLPEVPSIVLGTSDITLKEMVTAYSVFANRGKKIQLNAISKIESADGTILFEAKQDSLIGTKFDSTNIELINSILRETIQSGTGRKLKSNYAIPEVICGKTGTTQNQSDGWFVGYNPDLVIASWVGTQDRRIHFRYLGTGAGSSTALPMVGALFEYASKTDRIQNHEDFAPYLFDNCPSKLTDEQFADLQKPISKKSRFFKKTPPMEPYKKGDEFEHVLFDKEDNNESNKRFRDILDEIKRWKDDMERRKEYRKKKKKY